MPIGPDQTLLQYRLTEKLGEGGMGAVWKAVATSLDREVAIKVLPESGLASSDQMLARFEREAKLLASLNHPNIAAVYGLHETDGSHFIAMELVAGEDLARRIHRGRLSIDDALQISAQVAEALAAAHDRGVIHRDLKPANVMLTPEGAVKVLDFGLAKALAGEGEPGSGEPSISMSPTMTSVGTLAGMILGTAAYMSPEQARGKPVDRRADIWTLGCLVYEMLTGRTAFRGETVADTLAAVVRAEPDWDALPQTTPRSIRRVLRRMLRKDPTQRLRDAGDVRLELDDAPQLVGLPATGARGGAAVSTGFRYAPAGRNGLCSNMTSGTTNGGGSSGCPSRPRRIACGSIREPRPATQWCLRARF